MWRRASLGENAQAAEAYALATLLESGDPVLLEEMADVACRVARLFFGQAVSLCAIVSAKSGRCAEDCAFCAQSARHRTDSPVHAFLDVDDVAQRARAAKKAGATRFGIVSSGTSLSEADFARLLEAVAAVKDLGLAADASMGLPRPGQLEALQGAGLGLYHHNLETSRSFFPNICTTHAYDEDVAAVRQALALGLGVCCGGLFGLGESFAQRAELALTLADLGVTSVPVNFLNPIPGTPLAGRPILQSSEAGAILTLYRLILPRANLRVCGGRPLVFGADLLGPLRFGATGLMTGDYLTTPGHTGDADQDALTKAGYTVAGDA